MREEYYSVRNGIRSEDDIYKLPNRTITEFGKINFLFNNAGIAGVLGAI